jgi:hypothetical protein
MSQNVEFTPQEKVRWEQYKHFKDKGYTDQKISEQWGLTSTRQVTRLKVKAKANGAYTKWAKELSEWAFEEFKELHEIVKEKNPVFAYKTVAFVSSKAIATTVNTQTEITERKEVSFTIDALSPEERKFVESIADKYIKTSNKTGLEQIH